MDPLIALAIPVTIAGTTIAVQLWNRSRWAHSVFAVARELGLEYTPPRWHHRAHARGVAGKNTIHIQLVSVGAGKSRHAEMRIEVDTHGEVFDGLKLSKEGAFKLLATVFTGEDIHAGSEDFDREVKVEGTASEAEAVSYLNAAVRSAARVAIVDHGAKLAIGSITLQTRSIAYDAETLRDHVRVLVELSRALSEQVNTTQARLLANAKKDPEAPVRARNLSLLISEYRGSAEAKEAIEHGMSDPSAEVRVIAAAAKGEDGMREMLAIALDAGCKRIERVRAFEALGSRFLTADYAKPRAAMATSYLITRLDDRDDETIERAARALGMFAGLEAVEPLTKHTKGITTARKVKDAASAAIAAIQARHGGEGGRLSLAPVAGDAGALSYASGAEAGALSRVEAGQGSLAISDREDS